MGKSTCGAMLQRCGVPVHESDHAAHDLMTHDKSTQDAILEAFPSLSLPIDRKALGKIVFSDDDKRAILEGILHPRIQQSQNDFIKAHKAKGVKIVALDIPLLFETDAQSRVDVTAVVSAPYFLQKARVMKRPNMTAEKFQAILDNQMPDSDKRTRADYVIPTGLGKAYSMLCIRKMLKAIKKEK